MPELSVAFSLGLVTGFVVLVAIPFRRRVPFETVPAGFQETRHVLEARKKELVATLRDLNLDFRMGKLDEKDFHELDAQYRAQALDVLRKLDRGHGKSGESMAERLIAVYREAQGAEGAAHAKTNCTRCHQALQPQYRFCPRCGQGVSTERDPNGADS